MLPVRRANDPVPTPIAMMGDSNGGSARRFDTVEVTLVSGVLLLTISKRG
jgi:hypothetical protein